MTDWAPPAEFDGYRLIRPLGRGGMGHVYLGTDLLLERAVAIKFIAAEEVHQTLRERFLAEGRAIARLSHPNVVAIHRVSEVDGRPYFVSEYVRGQSLDALSRPLPWDKVLRIGIGLARGLSAAHRQGVLHRDIKPANAVLADGGEVKLLDFGLATLGPSEDGARSAASDGREPSPLARLPVDQSTLEFTGGRQRVGEKLVGTPRYMAPELLQGEPASRRSDLYSLGAVLFELCVGHSPRRQEKDRSVPPLEGQATAVNPRFASIIDRCLEVEPARRWTSADEVLDALEQVAPTHRSVPLPAGNPYRGLRAFDIEHRALFFGRDGDIRGVLERLRSESLVVLAGDSGVGKSSLCRAGVLPFVAERGLDSGLAWAIARLVPGREPLVQLAAAVAPLLRMDAEALTAWLRSEPSALARALERVRQTQPDLGLLVFVDQAEELLSLASKDDASRFAECCALTLSLSQHARWLMTVRGDFVTKLAALPGLGSEVQQSLYILRPLSPERLREAIVGPARACGVGFESEELVESLVNAGQAPTGSLPLLAFALSELWESRDQKSARIPATALDAMGGVSGALARHADGVLARLLPAQREEARRILLRLVNSDGTRTRCRAAELEAQEGQASRALNALVTGRLVVARDRGGETEYELAHETLARTWPALSAWLDADSESNRARQRVTDAAAEWERLGRSSDVLWHRRQLAEVRELDPRSLNEEELGFVTASRRRALLQRLLPAAFVAAVASLMLLAAVLSHARTKAGIQAQMARFQSQATESLRAARSDATAAAAKRAEAFALFDGTWRQPDAGRPVQADVRWDDAEAVWSDALAFEQRADSAYASASATLELALQLDPERSGLRSDLADVLFEQLRQWDTRLRVPPAGLRERLLAFDTQGKFRKQLEGPGSVAVAVTPLEADVHLERYGLVGNLLKPTAVSTPLHSNGETVLPAGSYRLAVASKGGQQLYYPFLVHPQRRTEVTLRLPPEGTVPRGFLYIAAGPFLLGSADDEALRTAQGAPPLHQAATGSFLISQTEVTFAEWVEYLEAGGAGRRAHTPDIESSKGLVRLRPHGAHWRLQLRPTNRDYFADWGEPLHYQGRDRLSVQDWRRFPVSGIALVDIQDYLSWLNASGKLPGARLCTEWEWERAARGADDRPFTTGYALPGSAANVDVTYGRKPEAFGPDEVGSHPESDSPFGLQDIQGNALEILAGSRPDEAAVGRGGAWYYDANLSARITTREVFEPQTRSVYSGFRVCASRDSP
ncbi:MAG: protein kinase domain-containing protein [Myxococcaceae bacterium]